MSRPSFRSRYGPWALVAGASEGIGAEVARQLAARGLNLALVADPEHPPEDVAREMNDRYGVESTSITTDLAQPSALDRIVDETRQLDLGLMVFNAAFTAVRPFASLSEADLRRMIDVNVIAPLVLTRWLVPRLAARGRGGVVLLSSVAAFHGAPLVAVYAATKAFNLILGESLWHELRPLGIDVLAWCPGATDTPAYRRSGARPARFFEPEVMPPRQVVTEALDALGKRPSGVAGLGNRLATALAGRLLSRRLAVTVMGQAMRRRYGPASYSASTDSISSSEMPSKSP